MHGLQAGELGFVAVQRSDHDGVDVIDIHTVSPGAVGAMLADLVGLVGVGVHPRIAVSSSGNWLPAAPEIIDEYDDFGFPIPRAGPREPAVRIVDGHDLVATGTVQSRYDRARHWGVDPELRVLQWVQIGDDGDYLYAPDDAGYAEPLDVETLRWCIDGLIADALAVARDTRSST